MTLLTLPTEPLASAVCVDHHLVNEVWPKVSQFIRQAMQIGDLGRFDRLESDLLAGDALLWLAITNDVILGVAVTQIVITECSKVCMIQACGGNGINNWLNLIGVIEAYARNERCDCVRLMGRKGWARLLNSYRADKVIMERRL